MGVQTMASQGGAHQTQIQSLARQGLIYNLTLSEVQCHLGEPLHSMNLDELLKNVFPAEENQFLGLDLDSTAAQYAGGTGLPRQGSITMPRALSKKTVDEVWRDIQQKKGSKERNFGNEGQLVFGEMTLEDFLVKAGVVTEGNNKRRSNLFGKVATAGSADSTAAQGYAQGAHWLQQYHQMSSVQHQQQQIGVYVPGRPLAQQPGAGTGQILDALYSEGQVRMQSPIIGTLSDSQTPGRKRSAHDGPVERTVERRQKRMIKNRESAARSRARKQAYTNELENKVSRLEEENERLKKQKALDTIVHYVPLPEPKYRLRRTNSAAF